MYICLVGTPLEEHTRESDMSPNNTSSQAEVGVSKMKPLVPTNHTHTQTDEHNDNTVLHLCLDMARLLKERHKGKRILKY